MDLALTGKRVLVTGRSRGIGKAIVASFLGEIHHRPTDLGDVESVNAYVGWAAETLGGFEVDIRGSQTLIHGARERMDGHTGSNTLVDGGATPGLQL